MSDDTKKFQRLCEFLNSTVHIRADADFHAVLTHFLPRIFKAERVSIAILDAARQEFTVKVLHDMKGFQSNSKTLPFEGTMIGKVLAQNRLIRWKVADHTDTLDGRLLQAQGCTVAMGAPIYLDGKPYGTINVGSSDPQGYSSYAATLLFTVASIIAAFLRRRKYIENERTTEGKLLAYSRRLEALNDASLRFATVESEDALIDVAFDTIGKILPAYRMSYVVPDFDKGLFYIRRVWGKVPDPSLREFPLANSIVEHCARFNEPKYIASLADEEYSEYDLSSHNGENAAGFIPIHLGMKAAWSVPIHVGGSARAVFNAASREAPADDSHILGVLSLLGNIMSVTLERIEVQEALRFQAFHDALTELPNRAAFSKRLRQVFEEGTSDECALLLVDICRFKDLNDYFGHHAGDAVLVHVAQRLRGIAACDDVVARLAGDEFAMLVMGDDREQIRLRLTELLDNPEIELVHDGCRISAKLSVGVSFMDEACDTTSRFMRQADLALHAAKTGQAGRAALFAPEMADAFERRIKLLDEFNRAIRDQQIKPYYQPVIDLRTGRVGGLEALARWEHPTRGILPPGAFMDIFSVRELCIGLGQAMLKCVTRDMGYWKRHRVPFEYTAINFTDSDFAQPGFALHLMRELARNDLMMSELMVEVTENSILSDKNDTIRKLLTQLRHVGAGVALDDFGTGFASLTHLSAIDFTVLKIDRSFVSKLTESHADFAIVEFLTRLGDEIGFVTTAEGIETEDERQIIERLNCRYGQGYLFAKPVPGEEVPDLIARLNRDAHAAHGPVSRMAH